MKVRIFYFYGNKDNYGVDVAKIASIGYLNEKNDWFGFSCGTYNKNSIVFLGNLVLRMIDNLKTIEGLKEIEFVVGPTVDKDLTEYKPITALLGTELHDLDRIKVRIERNDKFTPEVKEMLFSLIAKLKELIPFDITTSVGKFDEENIKAGLEVDSSANRAYYRLKDEYFEIYDDSYSGKEKRARVKAASPLLIDKFAFDILLPNMSKDDLTMKGLFEGTSIYYTGNTTYKIGKTKATKSDKIGDNANVGFIDHNNALRVAGKDSGESRANIVILKDGAKQLDIALGLQHDINSRIYNYQQISMFKLDTLYSAGVSVLVENKDMNRIGYTMQGDLFSNVTPRKDISHVFNPAGLGFKIKNEFIDSYNHMTKTLLGKDTHFVTDITDQLVEVDEKGKTTLLKRLESVGAIKLKNILLPSRRTVTMELLFKYKLPDIPSLKKICKDKPKIEFVIWVEDSQTYGYATLITTSDGWLFYRAPHGGKFLPATASSENRELIKGKQLVK